MNEGLRRGLRIGAALAVGAALVVLLQWGVHAGLTKRDSLPLGDSAASPAATASEGDVFCITQDGDVLVVCRNDKLPTCLQFEVEIEGIMLLLDIG